jgi:hypothetical protein
MGAGYRRSSFCSASGCVTVRQDGDMFFIRDSCSPLDEPQVYTRDEWEAFIAGVKAGEFDPTESRAELR